MIAAAHKSYFGACMASPMAWVLAGGLLIVMYFYVMKDMKRRLGPVKIRKITRDLPKKTFFGDITCKQ